MDKVGTLAEEMTFFPVVDGKVQLPDDMPEEQRKMFLKRDEMSLWYRRTRDRKGVIQSGNKARRSHMSTIVGKVKESVNR